MTADSGYSCECPLCLWIEPIDGKSGQPAQALQKVMHVVAVAKIKQRESGPSNGQALLHRLIGQPGKLAHFPRQRKTVTFVSWH